MARLSIDNKTEDVPQVLRATWRKGGRSYALVVQPLTGKVMLASFNRGATSLVATRMDGRIPSYNSMKPYNAKKAIDELKKLSRGAENPEGASLRGRWAGSVEHGTAGHPVVKLERKVGQASVRVLVPNMAQGCSSWTVATSMAQTWKGGPAKTKPHSVSSTSSNHVLEAFELARTEVRKLTKRLHGESDRRQAHDDAYAKKRPTKWSATPTNPVDRLALAKPATKAKAAASKAKAAPSKASAAPSKASASSNAEKPLSASRESKRYPTGVPAIIASENVGGIKLDVVDISGDLWAARLQLSAEEIGATQNALGTWVWSYSQWEVGHNYPRKGKGDDVEARRVVQQAIDEIRHSGGEPALMVSHGFVEAPHLARLWRGGAFEAALTTTARMDASEPDAAHTAGERARNRREKRRETRVAPPRSSLTQEAKDATLMMMVTKAIKDAMRQNGSR